MNSFEETRYHDNFGKEYVIKVFLPCYHIVEYGVFISDSSDGDCFEHTNFCFDCDKYFDRNTCLYQKTFVGVTNVPYITK